ncbi:MAG: hypothetical protein WDN49_03180 [Acetobacteraceae bacterium]
MVRMDESFGTRIASPVGEGGSNPTYSSGAPAAWEKDGRRLAGGAEIERAGSQRLQQLRAAGEFVPGDLPAQRTQRLLQDMPLPQDDERAVFLHADMQDLVRRAGRPRGGGGRETAQNEAPR